MTKLKPFLGRVRQSVQKYLNQNLVIESFLENGLEATLSSKTNVLSVSKEHSSVSCKFLSDDVETFFYESDTNRLKLFKLKICHKKLLKKWFTSHFDLKRECSERLKRAFFSFFPNSLRDEVETIFWESETRR